MAPANIRVLALNGLLEGSLAGELDAKLKTDGYVTLAADNPMLTHVLAVAFFLVSVFFVHRSFYGMRIEAKENA